MKKDKFLIIVKTHKGNKDISMLFTRCWTTSREDATTIANSFWQLFSSDLTSMEANIIVAQKKDGKYQRGYNQLFSIDTTNKTCFEYE